MTLITSLCTLLMISPIVTALLPQGGDKAPARTPRASDRSTAARLDFCTRAFGHQLGGWDAKGGRAAEYRCVDSVFRTWRCDVSRTVTGGLLVTFKIDHVRAVHADDHAVVRLEFDRHGRLSSARSHMTIAGRTTVDSGVVTAAAAPFGLAPVGWVAAKVANGLLRAVGRDYGGRRYFPLVVEHNIQRAASCIRWRR